MYIHIHTNTHAFICDTYTDAYVDNIIMFRHIDNLTVSTTVSNNIQIKIDFCPSNSNLITTNYNPLKANYLDLDFYY